ncbi:MAG TPA: hypothetical protein VJV79_15380 [Polyangiaceae bacterium]|nr:hypothetical protein [Polyangiaceae bacterium]
MEKVRSLSSDGPSPAGIAVGTVVFRASLKQRACHLDFSVPRPAQGFENCPDASVADAAA